VSSCATLVEFPIGVLYEDELFKVDWDEDSSKEWDWSVKKRPANPRSKDIPAEREWKILRVGHGFRGIVTLSRLDEESGKEVKCKFENPCFMQPSAIPGLTLIMHVGGFLLPCLDSAITSSRSSARCGNRTFSAISHGLLVLFTISMGKVCLHLAPVRHHLKTACAASHDQLFD
jgi:hypothetical protein